MEILIEFYFFFLLQLLLFLTKKINCVKIENENWIKFIAFRDKWKRDKQSLFHFPLFVRLLFGRSLANEFLFEKGILDFSWHGTECANEWCFELVSPMISKKKSHLGCVQKIFASWVRSEKLMLLKMTLVKLKLTTKVRLVIKSASRVRSTKLLAPNCLKSTFKKINFPNFIYYFLALFNSSIQ